jgi:signal peptidase II
MRARILCFVVIFFTSTGFDQASKAWARETLQPGVVQPVIPGYWDWQLANNPGAAFSTFAGDAHSTALHVGLGALAVVALIAIGRAALRTRPEQGRQRIAYALLAGGALGNLIDRIAAGEVTDFVRWHIHDHLWPIFNLADASLLVGVTLLMVEAWRNSRHLAPAA